MSSSWIKLKPRVKRHDTSPFEKLYNYDFSAQFDYLSHRIDNLNFLEKLQKGTVSRDELLKLRGYKNANEYISKKLAKKKVAFV